MPILGIYVYSVLCLNKLIRVNFHLYVDEYTSTVSKYTMKVSSHIGNGPFSQKRISKR